MTELVEDSDKFQNNTKFKTIKRRFKEFVVLQKSLEENNTLRMHLNKHNIKGPSKFNFPIGNMGEDLIEKRRKKLCEYLNVIQI